MKGKNQDLKYKTIYTHTDSNCFSHDFCAALHTNKVLKNK